MGKYFTGVQLLVGMVLLTSCLKTPSQETPKLPEIKIDQKIQQMLDAIKSEYNTCDKKDSEQPQVSNEVLVNKIVIEDQIDSQKTEYVECNGKVTSLGVRPLRKHTSLVKVSAPEAVDFSGKVNFVAIENHRTCASIKTKADSEDDFNQTAPLFKAWAVKASQASASGELLLSVEESTMKKMILSLAIHEGNNVLTVRYFGKCLVYKEKVDNNLGDVNNCEKAEELGSKTVLLELHVIRSQIDGINKIDQSCPGKN